ncbi:hypothetical protein F5X98DRAFT_361591 [Xylaria grammica]|nr:hypothetical protein F5X98DRAFT_361591 [Xylaria grammica]
MAAAGVDVGYLATHLGMPETNISGAISDPTADLVNAILAAVTTKAHEFDTLFSQKLQLEVELETSVRGAEAQRDASNETAKKALKDVEEIRQKLNEEETKRQTLENELQSLKSSRSTSQSDIDTLRSRIASLETSNRESLSIIDTKNSTNESLSRDLQAQHQKNLKLNQEITALQQAKQNAEAAASSSKIREQGLQRQLEAARRDVEWTDQELKKVSAEALNYRKEKGARIAELQRQNDDAASTVESLKRGEQQLRQRLQDAQRKADDALAKVQQLEEAAARREEDFQQQVDRLQRLHELTEQQNATQKNRLHAMEEREAQVKRECEDKIQRVSKELAAVNMDKEELVQANESLQAEAGRLEAMIASGSGGSPGQPGSAPQTPRPQNGSMYRPSSPFATPGSMRKSISATQALDEYYKVKGQLNDLEDLEELYAENERLQAEIQNMSHLSDETARKAESAASQAQAEITILRNQLRDLGAQIQMLLFNMHCQEKGLDELTIEETLHFQKLERGQRLVNEKLLQVTHELGQNMETVEDHNERIRLQQELDLFKDTLRGFQVKTEIESRASADELASALGRPPQDGVLASIEHNSPLNADEFDDYQRNRLQKRFDMLKNHTMTQNVAEELVEARAVDIQDRLSRDNENLTLQNERELADAETKRPDLTSTKRKLSEEVEEAKKAQLRKEFDAQHQIREELVAVKTSRDHLQRERAERLQPRPTPRPGSTHDSDERIQELIHEATDLKRDLEMTRSQLEHAQGQELERLNSAQEQYAQEMDNTLSTKEATIKELEQRADLAQEFHQQDLRAQAEIAASAQEAYENEVMKHGETAKALSNVRNEYNQLKTSATLMQKISEIRTRWEDANAQNTLLHKQLENSRISSDESLEAISAQPSSSDADKYRELSNYLRREKDILEVQLELKLEYTQSQLDEARLKLEQEHLMSKLEELNLFPRQAQAQLTEKITKIAELDQQNFKEAEMKQLQEDRDRWQKPEVEELKQKEAEAPLNEKIEELEKSIAAKEADWAERSRQLTTAKNLEAANDLAKLEEQADAQKNPTPVAPSEPLDATPSIEQELQNTRDQLDSAIAEKGQPVAEAHTQTNGDTAMENDVEPQQNGSAEKRIAASEARATEWEAKAKDLEQNQDTIALNKRLSEFKASMENERAQLQQDKERLDADFQLRMEQERKIWETEQASGQSEMKIPSTPQQPKLEAPAATPSTSVPDLNNLSDQEIRELVSKNATVRSIVQNNIKSKLAAEAKRLKEEHEATTKAELDQKIAQARDSATQLVTSRVNLKLNMTENRARMANAKIEVVETAAKETPQRPVGEVWEMAKVAKPPPAPKQPAPSATPTGPTATTAPTSQSTPSKQAPVSQETKLTPSTTIPPKPAAPNTAQLANNPFATSQQGQAPQGTATANPFAQSSLPTPQQNTPLGIPQPAQASASQIPKVSNLPLPGGARKPSGPQIPRGGARGGGAQRGRGGSHQGRMSMNPSADNFQPGAKRPRGDSEVGNGTKRPRGGGGAGS